MSHCSLCKLLLQDIVQQIFAFSAADQNMTRLAHWGGSHAEQNALSFADEVAGEDQLKHSHTKKRNKRQKGLEITFDPVAHKCVGGILCRK